MTPLPHRYDAHLGGGPSGRAELVVDGLHSLQAAPPVQYDGPGDAWSPEHLLLAAVQTCFLFTFRAAARMSGLEFDRLDIDATGTVDRDAGVTRFIEIVLRIRLTVPAGTDHGHAVRVLESSEKKCLVSASLSTPVRLEPEIDEADASSLPAHGAAGPSVAA